MGALFWRRVGGDLFRRDKYARKDLHGLAKRFINCVLGGAWFRRLAPAGKTRPKRFLVRGPAAGNNYIYGARNWRAEVRWVNYV